MTLKVKISKNSCNSHVKLLHHRTLRKVFVVNYFGTNCIISPKKVRSWQKRVEYLSAIWLMRREPFKDAWNFTRALFGIVRESLRSHIDSFDFSINASSNGIRLHLNLKSARKSPLYDVFIRLQVWDSCHEYMYVCVLSICISMLTNLPYYGTVLPLGNFRNSYSLIRNISGISSFCVTPN